MPRLVQIAALLIPIGSSALFGAGSFRTAATAGLPVDVVFHPITYSGAGGETVIRVCIDPDSAYADEMKSPLIRAISTWNDLSSTLDNCGNCFQRP